MIFLSWSNLVHNCFCLYASPVPFWMLVKLGLAGLCVAVSPAAQQLHVAWKNKTKHFLSFVFIRTGAGPQSPVLWDVL